MRTGPTNLYVLLSPWLLIMMFTEYRASTEFCRFSACIAGWAGGRVGPPGEAEGSMDSGEGVDGRFVSMFDEWTVDIDRCVLTQLDRNRL